MKRKLLPFEKLEVWQNARRLVVGIYECSQTFPKEERFGLNSQLNRAAVSVANNLAEGSGRASLKDQAHFTSQAAASDFIIAIDLGFTNENDTQSLLDQAYDLSVRIHNLSEPQLRCATEAQTSSKPPQSPKMQD